MKTLPILHNKWYFDVTHWYKMSRKAALVTQKSTDDLTTHTKYTEAHLLM